MSSVPSKGWKGWMLCVRVSKLLVLMMDWPPYPAMYLQTVHVTLFANDVSICEEWGIWEEEEEITGYDHHTEVERSGRYNEIISPFCHASFIQASASAMHPCNPSLKLLCNVKKDVKTRGPSLDEANRYLLRYTIVKQDRPTRPHSALSILSWPRTKGRRTKRTLQPGT